MTTLKEEWIEKIKKIERRNIYPGGGGYFTVMTDFYQAPDEIRYDKEMCLKVLLESNECIWNVPKEIKTIEFLEELSEKGYKGNILRAKDQWPEEDFPFLKKYLSKYDKKNKPSFDVWHNTKGIFSNRDMVLSLVKEDNFHDTKILLERFNKDKEIMFALLDNYPGAITDVLKSIKNAYFKDQKKIYHVLNHHVNLYREMPEKFQAIPEVINYALSKNSALFWNIPTVVIQDRDKVFSFIKENKNVRGQDIPLAYRTDYEIAQVMIDRDGSNFTAFEFPKNEQLIRLAAKTYDNISHIPATEEYRELIREVVLRADKEKNEKNLSSGLGNSKKADMVKDLFPQLLKEEKVYNKTIADFFKSIPASEVGKEAKDRQTNIVLERPLLIECIKVSHYVYENISSYYHNEINLEIIASYVGAAKTAGKNFRDRVPQKYQYAAKQLNVDLDKYILNEYLAQKMPTLPKEKLKKI